MNFCPLPLEGGIYKEVNEMIELIIIIAITCIAVLLGSLVQHFSTRINLGEVDEDINNARTSIFRTLTFSPRKLYWYPKSCKWLWIVLNIWFPCFFVIHVSGIISVIKDWESWKSGTLIVNIIVVVVLLIADLLGRFLDKSAFWSIIVANIVLTISYCFTLVSNLDIWQLLVGIVAILIIAFVATIAYIINRYDLFYHSEKELIKAYK